MKNSTIVKKVLVMVIMVAVICLSTSVFAAESGSFTSLGTGNSSANSSASGNNSAGGNISSMSTNSSTNLSTTNNTLNSTANTTNSTTLNSSYNSTNLPETGLQDSLPIVVLIVVLGISSVYAYKKVKDYQNL